MSTLSQSLTSAADKAEAEAQEAIAEGRPEWAEACLRRAAQFRRLATNHRAKAILSGDPSDDPAQITGAPSGMTGQELRATRDALGLSQAELARALDVTVSTISRWETGHKPIGNPGMVRLALEALAMRRAAE